jgi:hypothetical protein
MSYPPWLVSSLCCSGQGTLFVLEDAHEVREAGDVEDLHVVLREAAGQHTPLRSARLRQQAHYQGYARGVDVVHPLEVEQDDLRVPLLGFVVGGVESFPGEAVDLAVKVHDGATGLLAHARLKPSCRHRYLLSGAD